MTQSPLNCREYVLLHLDEGRLVIGITANLHQILHGRDAFLGILKLCRDPESGTTNELVVFNVDDAARDIAIDDVEGQVERFWSKAEGEVDLDEEVNETRSHMPSNLGLLIHGLSRTHGVLLKTRDLSDALWKRRGMFQTSISCMYRWISSRYSSSK